MKDEFLKKIKLNALILKCLMKKLQKAGAWMVFILSILLNKNKFFFKLFNALAKRELKCIML